LILTGVRLLDVLARDEKPSASGGPLVGRFEESRERHCPSGDDGLLQPDGYAPKHECMFGTIALLDPNVVDRLLIAEVTHTNDMQSGRQRANDEAPARVRELTQTRLTDLNRRTGDRVARKGVKDASPKLAAAALRLRDRVGAPAIASNSSMGDRPLTVATLPRVDPT
jgi:hypothetical protein